MCCSQMFPILSFPQCHSPFVTPQCRSAGYKTIHNHIPHRNLAGYGREWVCGGMTGAAEKSVI